MKVCCKCKKKKFLDEFHKYSKSLDGHDIRCKECKKNIDKNYLSRTDIKIRRKAHSRLDKSRIWKANYMKEYLKKPEQKEYLKEYRKGQKWKEYFKKYMYRRYHQDPKFRLNNLISRGMRYSLHGKKTGHHWESFVDFTLDQLERHLEKQFKQNMSWENLGSWHIDHVIPVSAFNFESPDDLDFKRCWKLSNLQPLWGKENQEKTNKLSKPFQPNLMLKIAQ